MSGGYDPRWDDPRDRDEDLREIEMQWVKLGRGLSDHLFVANSKFVLRTPLKELAFLSPAESEASQVHSAARPLPHVAVNRSTPPRGSKGPQLSPRNHAAIAV